jgi:hypothetical protein
MVLFSGKNRKQKTIYLVNLLGRYCNSKEKLGLIQEKTGMNSNHTWHQSRKQHSRVNIICVLCNSRARCGRTCHTLHELDLDQG